MLVKRGSLKALLLSLVVLFLVVKSVSADTCVVTDRCHELSINFADVRDFGAAGNGEINDTPCIQAAIDCVAQRGGGTVFFPAGTYLIFQAGVRPWCLLLQSNIDYVGVKPGSILKLAPFQDRGVRMMATEGAEISQKITIRNLEFNGNRDEQKPSTCPATCDRCNCDPDTDAMCPPNCCRAQCNFEQQHAVILSNVQDCHVENWVVSLNSRDGFSLL